MPASMTRAPLEQRLHTELQARRAARPVGQRPRAPRFIPKSGIATLYDTRNMRLDAIRQTVRLDRQL